MHQIGLPRTVLKSLESEEFKTVLGCPIWCIFDQDICIKIFLKSVGPPVHFIFSLYLCITSIVDDSSSSLILSVITLISFRIAPSSLWSPDSWDFGDFFDNSPFGRSPLGLNRTQLELVLLVFSGCWHQINNK